MKERAVIYVSQDGVSGSKREASLSRLQQVLVGVQEGDGVGELVYQYPGNDM